MKIGFLYAGQGSQYVGMGKDFYEKYPLFRESTDQLSRLVDFNLRELCFDGPEEKLKQTRYTQPAMVLFAVGITKLLYQQGIVPDFAMGLSLGEYSALYAAGVFTESDVVQTVAFRGLAMEEASKGKNVGMASVLALDNATVEKCCAEASAEDEVVQAVNYNCNGNVTISGDIAAVERATRLLDAAGALRVVPLPVSVACHTPLMKPAGDALAERFRDMNLTDENAKCRVIYNCTGTERMSGTTISELLVRQVQSPVYVEKSIQYMAEHGVETFIEIGPGNVLSKLAKRILKKKQIYTIDTVEDFENLMIDPHLLV